VRGPKRRTPTARIAVAAAAVVVLVVLALVVAVSRGSSKLSTAVPASLPGELTGPAPWPANTGQLRARLDTLGLPALAVEGEVLHIHQHLDLYLDGRHVQVAPGIGIDPSGFFYSPLHTHDVSGVIHVESQTVRRFTLGELFGVWGVRFRNGCVGGYCAGGGKVLRVYVNGRRVTGDPGQLELEPHQEIVVAYGTPRQVESHVHVSYDFPPGE